MYCILYIVYYILYIVYYILYVIYIYIGIYIYIRFNFPDFVVEI